MSSSTAIEGCFNTITAGGAMQWFLSLTQSDQEKYLRLAEEYAFRFFTKSLGELYSSEHTRVHELVRRHYPR